MLFSGCWLKCGRRWDSARLEKNSESPAAIAAAKIVGGLDEEEIGLQQPDDEIDEATHGARRHMNTRLQTALTSEGLQRRPASALSRRAAHHGGAGRKYSLSCAWPVEVV